MEGVYPAERIATERESHTYKVEACRCTNSLQVPLPQVETRLAQDLASGVLLIVLTPTVLDVPRNRV